MKLFAVAAPGLESVVAAELRALALGGVEVAGGVELEGDREAVWRANLWSRTATRILVRVGELEVTDFARLRRFVAGLPWERFIAGPVALDVSASARKSRLYHTGAIAERVRGGIEDRVGSMQGESPVRVLARIEHDVATVSIDSSGELLHRRGYRTDIGDAPLRETLAAGVLSLAGWTPDEPLVDPTCGSGTFVIEAGLVAAGRPPGAARRFAFESWADFDPSAYASLKSLRSAPPAAGAQRNVTARGAPAALIGMDRDPDAIAAAVANAARAGVPAVFRCVEVERAVLPEGNRGLVVANPPYGRRLPALGRVYAAIGALARRSGWRLALLTPDDDLARKAGRFARRIALSNGGVRVGLFLSG
jgi:putative N6-adenine-specific DNA methylase